MTYDVISCKCCGQHLALTNGSRIVFGEGGYCDEPIPLKCSNCGARRVWKPLPMLDSARLIRYTELTPA